mgnify:CR=1 FL=1
MVEDAIRACAAAGEAQVLRGIAALSRAEAAKPHQAEANRLRKLCEARRQCRELALLCEHYYERGFYRYASDSFQGLAP